MKKILSLILIFAVTTAFAKKNDSLSSRQKVTIKISNFKKNYFVEKNKEKKMKLFEQLKKDVKQLYADKNTTPEDSLYLSFLDESLSYIPNINNFKNKDCHKYQKEILNKVSPRDAPLSVQESSSQTSASVPAQAANTAIEILFEICK